MLRPTPRRLLAVLAALLVICSIGGSPVAAMATDDTGLTDDGMTTGFDSPAGTDGDADADADDGEADDGESNDDDGDADDGESNDDEEGSSEGDGDDGDTDDEGADDTGDEGTADGETDGADADERETGDDADTDRESGADSYATEEGSHDVGEWGDAADYDPEDTESLVEANEAAGDDVFGPVDGLEGDTEAFDDLYDGEIDTTDETVDVRTLTISIGVLELELLTYDDGTGAVPADEESLDAIDTPPLRAAAGTGDGVTGDGVTGGERGVVVEAEDGGGGEPLPPTPGGGAVVALGTLAAVAAVRSSPFVATEGAKTASSTGTSLLSSLLEKFRPFVLPLRYSRYDDSDPLEHEAREQVYAIVNEEPGSYLSEVSEEADLPLSTTRHHIRVLEREELVSGAKLRGKRRFYPAYAQGIELAAALNDDSTATIIDAISRFGASSVSDLAEELERDPSTISHHLQRLEEDDIVTRERDGRAVVTRLSSEARTALEPESTPRPGETGEVLAGGAD